MVSSEDELEDRMLTTVTAAVVSVMPKSYVSETKITCTKRCVRTVSLANRELGEGLDELSGKLRRDWRSRRDQDAKAGELELLSKRVLCNFPPVNLQYATV